MIFIERILYQLCSLLTSEYQTSLELSEQLKLSSKTTRKYLKELSALVMDNGAFIKSKSGSGYKITITDENVFQSFLKKEAIQSNESLPSTAEERINYLTNYFLTTPNYVKLDEISDALFVSKKTLSADLKMVEKTLKKYDLFLERRPKYGIKVCGSEFNIRLCLANQAYQSGGNKEQSEEYLVELNDFIGDFLRREKFEISEFALQNLALHIYISFERIHAKQFVKIEEPLREFLRNQSELEIARKLMEELSKKYQIEYVDDELFYISMHISGKKNGTHQDSLSSDNLIIRTEVMELVNEMLEAVDRSFHVDFKNDLEMQMQLATHLVPLITRIQFGIHLKNPLIENVKKNFSFAYALAATACTVLTKRYKKPLDEDEIGYIALIFALVLEQQHAAKKMNVLLVCRSGKSSSHLLKITYEKAFENYINDLVLCSLAEIENCDLTKFDYIFTTVPIHIPVPIPILEVNYILEKSNIEDMKNTLFKMPSCKTQEYYKEELFFPNLDFKTKEEVLQFLCKEIERYDPFIKGIYDSVMVRENLADTQFGHLFAIPHPYTSMSNKTLVSVGILNKPIQWNNGMVQVIFLTSFGNEDVDSLNHFYDTTSKFLLSADSIQKLIQNQDYNEMIENFIIIERS